MGQNNSILANRDIIAAMDRALANGRGVRIACSTIGEANNLRQRFYTARVADRKENKKIYPEGDPLHGRSVYDSLVVYPASGEKEEIYCVIEVSSPERLEERMEEL